MRHRTKKTIRIVLTVLLMVFCCGMIFNTSVNAADNQGDGDPGGTSSVRTCNTAKYVRNIETCNKSYGGASWHVFSTKRDTSKKYYGKPTKYIKTYDRKKVQPVYYNKSGILSNKFNEKSG